MAKFEGSIKIEGVEELIKNMALVVENIEKEGEKVIGSFSEELAEGIKTVFDGSNIGFQNRTGALRRSINGGFLEKTDDALIGFISAGDDEIGSNQVPNREYAAFVEFGEFSRAGKTSFLRAGAELGQRNFFNALSKIIVKEDILK